MYDNNEDISKVISITEDFVKFLNKLYSEGTINYEQYEIMTSSKKEFLNNIKSKS